MFTWIRENAALFTLGAGLIACISTVAVDRYRISGLFASQPAFHQHLVDTTRHIDPQRDAEAMKEMKERIDRLERRLDRSERRSIWMPHNVRPDMFASVPTDAPERRPRR